jgi:hypothetical protein
MSAKYTGLPKELKEAVYARDNFRCRWCGSTNRYGYDVHHIQYRRGYSYDVIENLVTVCRSCHTFVHDSFQIPKPEAQLILTGVISAEGDGQTGMALWRRHKRANEDPPSTGRVGRLM